MVKRNVLSLLLFLCMTFAIGAQDGDNKNSDVAGTRPSATRRNPQTQANTDFGKLTFFIINETGFTIKAIYICKSNAAGQVIWGENILASPIYKGESFTVNLDNYDFASTYNIRLMDADGDYYSKFNLNLKPRGTIKIEIADFEL